MPHARHLVRMAALFGVGILAFLVLRLGFVPRDFGRQGHYRDGALADNRARPLAYAGTSACLDCHGEVRRIQRTRGSRHAGLACEACHGPQAPHVADPAKVKPLRPEATGLCLACHRKDPARPAGFPQQDPRRHNPGAACNDCHSPHTPGMEAAP